MTSASPLPTRWQRFSAASVRAFHGYAGWLVSISWWRFALLSLLLLIAASVLENLPPFNVKISEEITEVEVKPPKPPKPPKPGEQPAIKIERPAANGKEGVDITIDSRGIRIMPKAASGADSAASAPSPAASAAAAAEAAASQLAAIEAALPRQPENPVVREAVEEARRAIRDAVAEARDEAREAAEAAAEAHAQAEVAGGKKTKVRVTRLGDHLPDFAFFWIVASLIIKITYKRQIQAEAQAAQAVETAEAESLKRQVVEARMAAMQAQIEPHFLFNTLASIDHLIEVDPQRASQMQKNLIALLRASMPSMRETQDGHAERPLERELAVIRPYLEILKVRMEERLTTAIEVPAGLLSAEFPAMMIQTLVENAIKHGLEPKPEGGHLTVSAEIVHGKLAVTVADTGLGFGAAPTAGTGVGLANIRERLALRYGSKASLTVAENPGGGTRVCITVPYKSLDEQREGNAA